MKSMSCDGLAAKGLFDKQNFKNWQNWTRSQGGFNLTVREISLNSVIYRLEWDVPVVLLPVDYLYIVHGTV